MNTLLGVLGFLAFLITGLIDVAQGRTGEALLLAIACLFLAVVSQEQKA